MNTREFVITIAVLFALMIAMSVYVSQLRRREMAALRVHSSPKAEHARPPTSGRMEQVAVLVAYDNPGVLREQSIPIPVTSDRQQRAEELLRALIGLYTAKSSPHPLALGSDVRNVFLVDPGIAVIDLNSTLVDSQVSGVLSEELTIASLIQTLAANCPELTRVKFLADGKQRDTLAGHVELSQFYEVARVGELAKELSR